MNATPLGRWLLGAGLGAAAIVLTACASMSGSKTVEVTLSGAEEVPPVATAARGSGKFVVGEDKSVSGGITVTGLSPVAAHIHTGARGQNGPVAVPLQKTGDAGWSVAPGAKLTDAQYDAFKAGNTYVNVHTPANKGGEIRGQLRP
jgi:hypothetical protein